MHTMNNVDYLLRVQFSTLPLEEKLEIKRLGPHRPDDLILLQPGQKATRTFKTEWYDRKTWLTASTSNEHCSVSHAFFLELVLMQTQFGQRMDSKT